MKIWVQLKKKVHEDVGRFYDRSWTHTWILYMQDQCKVDLNTICNITNEQQINWTLQYNIQTKYKYLDFNILIRSSERNKLKNKVYLI